MKRTPDVLIIGAGPAGIAAAAAASALGASVMLVEQSHRLGGSVTAALHRSICGLYADSPGASGDTLNGGVQRTLVERMVEFDSNPNHAATEFADSSSNDSQDPTKESATPVSASKPKPHQIQHVKPRQFGKAWVLEFPAAAWSAALDALVDHPLIDRHFGTSVKAVRREGNHITSVDLAGESSGTITPKVMIDCTGGGSVLRLIGCDVIQPPDKNTPRMLAGYGVRLTGIGGHLELLRLQIPYALAKAVQHDELPDVARFTTFYPGPGAGEGVCKLALPTSMSELESHARADAIVAVLRKHVPGFESAAIVETSPHAVPRDGDRLLGRATLQEADVLAGAAAEGDAIKAWWPIEHWSETAGPMYAYPPVGQPYAIPLDCLRSATIENLLAAGNAISATSAAAASSRASGICLATGDAAGRLALQALGQKN